MKPLLIIKTGQTVTCVPPDCGDFEHWIAEGTGRSLDECRVCNVIGGEALPDPAQVGSVVITGSAAMVSDRLDWSERTADWLAEVVKQGAIPVLGICYGHQLLAHALGGHVDYHPEGREIGTVDVRLGPRAKEDPLFAGMPQQFTAQVSHMQSVLRLPAGATILADNAFEPHHAVRYAPTAWGVQFHPEFSSEVMHAYVEARESDLLQEGWSLPDLRAAISPTEDAARLLQLFANLA